MPAAADHYNFVDLTGKTVAGVLIVRRAPNVNGNARWVCRFPCEHVRVFQGISIRAAASRGGKMACRECPKQPSARHRRSAFEEVPTAPRQPVERRCAHGFVRSVAPCVECNSVERGVPVPPPESNGDARSSQYVKKTAGIRPYRCSKCGESGHSKQTCKGVSR